MSLVLHSAMLVFQCSPKSLSESQSTMDVMVIFLTQGKVVAGIVMYRVCAILQLAL